ncbi:MAG TPA: hypothetical protein VLI04_08655 [Nocardioidaceae bacterium]|nr:hypothetical protein [Nocardioidaceae bacterium]
MRSKAVAILTTALVLLVTSPAYAEATFDDEPPPSDNGRWVAVVAFLIFVAIVAGMLFIARAYTKDDRNQ